MTSGHYRPVTLAEYARRVNIWLARVQPRGRIATNELLGYHNTNYFPCCAAADILKRRGVHWQQPGCAIPDILIAGDEGGAWGTEPPERWAEETAAKKGAWA